MRNIVLLIALGMSVTVQGQVKTPRGSKMAGVSEEIGITDVSINYSRPGNMVSLLPWDSKKRRSFSRKIISFSRKIIMPGALLLFTYGGLLEKAGRLQVTNFGLAKGYAAMGDKTAAIKYADLSMQLAQDGNPGANNYVGRFKQDLADGKDVSGY